MSRSHPSPSIQIIHQDSPYFQEVNKLGDENKKTLGFTNYSTFKRYAENPGIIVALVDRDLAGYLMWSINSKTKYARLWHLCIKPEYRGQKITKPLNNKLIELTRDKFRGINLECKPSYGIDEMWIKLGYVPIHEKDAKTPGEILKIWSIEFIHPGYSSIFSTDVSSDYLQLKSAIDAESLHKFMEDEKSQNNPSSSLTWLRSYLGVCITDEIFNEIDNFHSDSDKKNLREIAKCHFSRQVSDPSIFDEYMDKIISAIDKNNFYLERTSVRYLARCAASDIPYFITYKEDILKISDFLYVHFGVRSMSLENIIQLRDEIIGQLDYQPLRLTNNILEKRSLDYFQLDNLLENIKFGEFDENRNQMLIQLRSYISQKEKFTSTVLVYDSKPYICIVYDRSKPNRIEIPFLRCLNLSSISYTLMNHVVDDLIKKAISERRDFLYVIDPDLGDLESRALKNQYFIQEPHRQKWIKYSPLLTLTSQQAADQLQLASQEITEYASVSQILVSLLNSNKFSSDILAAIDIERLLWPLKVSNSSLPNFIVPIKPEAAKELFDYKLAKQTLFGVQKDSLFLSVESVYYKSLFVPRRLKHSPARILWYVSQSKDKFYLDLSSIRACSQVDDVIIDSPEELHKRFQHLGFYELPQIQACATKKKNNKVMAIKFSHTELFDNPIKLDAIREYLENPKLTIQSATEISQDQFINFYNLGFQSKSK
ncbi:GNAT family N-acetyltransferase [Roseofilum casamattae]|uniref:GNAT family N-acetyltransferase n=1 Tax=Roseofilum casamattae BLCC-M143 TaxID=3022442 RepID=A0ABT7BT25_9CYAN|nr:GNAT family N-acetyltransferase [Roseofilum casamattae]MDJ1182337.1 GNAT family N-acetyltransferase [Roseofilum casamattae BLCC-M143]